MHQWIESVLVEIMACRLFDAKLLSKRMLVLLSIVPLGTNVSEILIKIQTFHSQKCIWKYHLQNGGHFVQGRWVDGSMFLKLWDIKLTLINLIWMKLVQCSTSAHYLAHGANEHMNITLHNCRSRQFHRTSNKENLLSVLEIHMIWQYSSTMAGDA